MSLSKCILLGNIHSDTSISLNTDACYNCLCGVLDHYENIFLRPLGFFRKQLNKSRRSSKTLDKELISIYLTVEHF